MFQPCLCQISQFSFLSDPYEYLILSETDVSFKKKEKRSLKSSKTQTNSCRSSSIKESAPKMLAKSTCSIEYSMVRQCPKPSYQTICYVYPSLKIVKSEHKISPPVSPVPIKHHNDFLLENHIEKTCEQQSYPEKVSAEEIKLETPSIQSSNSAKSTTKIVRKLSEIPEQKSSLFNSYIGESEFSFEPNWPQPKTVVSLDSSRCSECDSVVIDYPLQVSKFNKLL